MSNKEIIDLNVLTKLAAAGKELTAIIRQRLAILLADLAQLPSVQQRLAELGGAFGDGQHAEALGRLRGHAEALVQRAPALAAALVVVLTRRR